MEFYDVYKNRATKAFINLDNFRDNFKFIKGKVNRGVKIMGLVKADAYGHGILKISKKLEKLGANYLGVAYIEEAIYLRKNGVELPILVLGACDPKQTKDYIKYDIEANVASIYKAQEISAEAKKLKKKIKVHIKVDTGMARVGVQWYNAKEYIDIILKLDNLKLVGLFSHLANSQVSDSNKGILYKIIRRQTYARTQMMRFEEIVKYMKDKKALPKIVHISNSNAVYNYPDANYNMVRCGLSLYGYSPIKKFCKELKPVMTVKSEVIFFKFLKAFSWIGYDLTKRIWTNRRIATLPIGYGDGYNRRLSNTGKVFIRGKKHKIIGKVCMDQTMVDLGKFGTAYCGDEVLLLGESVQNGKDIKISLKEFSKLSNMSPYEILCSISKRVPRIYIEK